MNKQFRCANVYRLMAIGEKTPIKGISNYNVKSHDFGYKLEIVYVNGNVDKIYFIDETELKLFITMVNKNLNNCRKPGSKPGSKRRKKRPYYKCL